MKRLAFLALLFAACSSAKVLPVEPPAVVVFPRDGGAGCCEPACARMRESGCPEGDPSETGESCEDLCRRITAMRIDMGACCVAASRTKDELLSCGTTKSARAVRCQH
jgi:hypothetical protein